CQCTGRSRPTGLYRTYERDQLVIRISSRGLFYHMARKVETHPPLPRTAERRCASRPINGDGTSRATLLKEICSALLVSLVESLDSVGDHRTIDAAQCTELLVTERRSLPLAPLSPIQFSSASWSNKTFNVPG